MIKRVQKSIFRIAILGFSIILFSACQNSSATNETHKDNQTTQHHISIISPTDGSHVCMKTLVSGTIFAPSVQVFVLIHPMTNDRFWVQPVSNMRPDGKWESYCHFGESKEGIGQPFEIIAIASKNKKLFKEGDTLLSPLPDNLPIILKSIPITVKRDSC